MQVPQLTETMTDFMISSVYPAEAVYARQLEELGDPHAQPPVMEELKAEARRRGLWNLFLPHAEPGHTPLSNVEYAPIAEIAGRSLHLAPEAMNCSAPDTGNMELLSLFASPEQKERWLAPLLDGKIRSSYVMTEPEVASADASNISFTIERDGDELVLNGKKWWISGAGRPECTLLIVLGLSEPEGSRHARHSVVLVPKDTPGITLERELTVMGYHPHDSHMEINFDNVRVPASSLLGRPGQGFAMAQARLGPGRIHHCMRLIGMAERALEIMVHRTSSRVAFGVPLVDQGVIREWIADSRVEIDQARHYTMHAAHLMDTVGNKAAASEISGIKVVVPSMATRVIDRAIQACGAAGLSQDFPLARLWVEARTVRFADGPDEVHRRAVARTEIKRLQSALDGERPTLAHHLRQEQNS
ncbi:acyl-CoA dehydrogenase family protein [Rhodococcus koreensis]|uniref:Acyl-CoA dehydrogenase n=1 Tax=Rhodococcus koreensis TaxID=99653 RepID=A0A1H4KYV1_9NOCA|nr:acyl-CoA dehydrogenase family protein [Rhodococcus koreensis]SEB63690.1 acyl-CoA dehydrogenase [Rhodococcus koreensis]